MPTSSTRPCAKTRKALTGRADSTSRACRVAEVARRYRRPMGERDAMRRSVALATVAVVVCLAAAAWAGQQWEPRGGTSAHANHVVLVGIQGLTFADLTSGRMPRLSALAADGSRAALNVRTASRLPSAAEAYATIGAAARAQAGPDDDLAYDAGQPVANVTAADALAVRTGAHPSGGVVALGMAALRARGVRNHLASLPGALGQALHASGRRTAVVGDQAAALASSDQLGTTDTGTVDPARLPADPVLLSEVDAAARAADLVVVDPGKRPPADVDGLIGDIADTMPPDTLLMVAGTVPPTAEWALLPLVVTGPGLPAGAMSSSATKRTGLVTLRDVAPTVLHALNVPVPATMSDTPMLAHRGGPGVADLAVLNRDTVYRERVYYPITIWYIVLQVLAYVAAAVAVARARRRPRAEGPSRATTAARWLRPLALATAAFPLCTYIWRAIPGMSTTGWSGVVVLVAITAAATALASRDRRHPLAPLAWLLGATVVLMLIDTASGARLEPASILGYSPHTSARFFGLGNTAMAILATAAILLAVIWIDVARDRRRAFVESTAMLAVVFVVAAAPTLGSKVGAFLTLLPVFAALVWRLAGRRITWRVVVSVVLLAGVAVAVAGGIDAMRPAGERTHLGSLFRDTSEGGTTPARLVVLRKL